MTAFPALISVDRRLRKTLQQQIYEGFRTRILSGDVSPGQPVPSSRALATELSVSRFPVLNAYAQLHAEGYFESRSGSGTFVATSLRKRAHAPVASSSAKSRAPRPIASRCEAVPEYVRPTWRGLGPFQIGHPDLNAFPLDVWTRLAARHARAMRHAELGYGDVLGYEPLRKVIAAYLRTSRGVKCDAGQVMIVSGSQQALDLTARVLLDPCVDVWLEDPGYWLAQNVVRAADARIVPVPVDEGGLDVSRGIAMSPRARAAFVAPSHQYPLGVTMSAARRLALLEWARRSGGWIVEDDYDSEYRFGAPPLSSLQGLDNDSRVIYIGSFSKVLFPSLRVGYIVIPTDLIAKFETLRQCSDLCPSTSNQVVLADFIREGHFARHIRRTRRMYAERYDALASEVVMQLGEHCSLIGDAAGMHLTVLLHNTHRSDAEIAAAAAERGLTVSALSLLSASHDPKAARQGLVLGFGNTRVEQIPAAIALLKACIR